MGDEFKDLSSAVVLRSEDEVRDITRAEVIALSCPEAVADDVSIEKAIEALHQAEQLVESLEQQLQAAAEHESGLSFVPTLSSAKHEKTESPSTTSSPISAEALAFRLKNAQRELSNRETELFRLRADIKKRKAQRLADAVRTVAEQSRAEKEEVARTKEAFTVRQNERNAARPKVVPFLPTKHRETPQGVTSSPFSRPTLPTAHPSLRRRISNASLTLDEYRGGPLLPNIYRVDVKGVQKRIRYIDDTSDEAFQRRLKKREKLEELQQQQIVEYTALSQVSVSSGAPQTATEPGEGVEVIDVDALMEMEEKEMNAVLATQIQPVKRERDGVTKHENEIDMDAPLAHFATVKSQNAVKVKEEPLIVSPPPSRDGSISLADIVELGGGVSIPGTIYDRLLDFQQEGVQWLVQLHTQRCGGILGDEMGLGKTIQIAALLCALTHSHQLRGPTLLVAPVTVLRQWVAELHRWSPRSRVLLLHQLSAAHGSTTESLINVARGEVNAIVLTSYAAMRRHCEVLQTAGFHYVILDEGHKISNPTAGMTLAAKSFPTPHRLLLSGSPIQNSLKELWCLFDFVRPGILGTLKSFTTEFEEVIGKSKNNRASSFALAEAVEAAKVLQERIAPYLLRRLKRQVNALLPEKYEKVIYVPLSDAQLQEYIAFLASNEIQTLIAQTSSYQMMSGGLDRDFRDSSGSLRVAGRAFNMANRSELSKIRAESFKMFHRLRQLCNHVDIFRLQHLQADDEVYSQLFHIGADGEVHSSNRPVSRSFRSNFPAELSGSGKLQTLQRMLAEWSRGGHRALVFSQTRMMLDIIENMVENEGHRYVRMDGTTPVNQRQELMDRFNEDDSITLALLTTRVGGVGLNLTGADRVVIFDPDWNPTTDAQARERAWRVGQRREVCVYRLITIGTVEEFIFKRQLAKMYVTDKVLRDPEYQRFFTSHSFIEGLLLGSIYDGRVPEGAKHVLIQRDMHLYDRSTASPMSLEGKEGSTAGSPGHEVVVPYNDFGSEGVQEFPEGGMEEEGEEGSPTVPPSSPAGEGLSVLQNLVDGATVHDAPDAVAHRLAAFQMNQRMQRVAQSAPSRSAEQQAEEYKKLALT